MHGPAHSSSSLALHYCAHLNQLNNYTAGCVCLSL